MRFANITTCDIANGKGLGVVLWCQGCSLSCAGCHNDCAHNPAEGSPFTSREEDLIMKELKRPQISRLVSLYRRKRYSRGAGYPRRPIGVCSIAQPRAVGGCCRLR